MLTETKDALSRSEIDRVISIIRGEPEIRRSRDKASAVARLRDVLEAKTSDDRGEGEEPINRAYRRSSLAGKKFMALVEENPRRPGSHGHRSLQIIIDNPMITYEDFIDAGGRRVDLAWDLEHKNVRMRVRG